MQHMLNRRSHLILSLVMIGSITLAAGSYRRPGKIKVNCCESVSRKEVKFDITRYKIQPEFNRCVKAVIFYTKEKGLFCADPKAPWVRKKIRKLQAGARLPKRIIEFLH
ncbi:eotaxin-like isoform X2 [Scyliorhinus canicula]|uniref:eotaxin-like isoform X2 n=1 Tax=Scyliorhinus canicula TaxID=7830 RepID=UPI0018F4FBD5|nr:eotaxin-like isoform X2 [Scyliorhinus canicula]